MIKYETSNQTNPPISSAMRRGDGANENDMTVQELINELDKVKDKSKTIYIDVYNSKQDDLLPIFSVYDTNEHGNNVNIATYEGF